MRLLPRRAGVLAFRPFESTRGTLSFFTRIQRDGLVVPPLQYCIQSVLTMVRDLSSMPRKLNMLCELFI